MNVVLSIIANKNVFDHYEQFLEQKMATVGYWERARMLSLQAGKIRWPGDTMQPPSDEGWILRSYVFSLCSNVFFWRNLMLKLELLYTPV